MTLDELNSLSRAEAMEAFRGCCGATVWARGMATRRPFRSEADLLSAADEVWSETGPGDWLEAFSYHPRIGSRVSGREAAEQASAQSAEDRVKAELAEVNRRYEERFGHIYIVCATGKSAEEMLALAKQRMVNTPDRELRIAAEEQRKITQLRLRKLLS